ncbi:hypothetical protein [Streptomyces gobiensis]|uniref:hypothetical protein n=1 Tax=Streptomyces gobiensis TaxID=2875706 RepID=UPI001E55FAAC|nr:hypothetical protein [Streptomyces gobiensis]UGY90323.1 hypothetical protein test1122_00335 [Streptomyces gobiensis]
MRTVKSLRTGVPEHAEDAVEAIEAYETLEIFRVNCPDCAQPIALLADEKVLPEHALCPTPWDPFGLRVCQGSGRAVDDAEPEGASREPQEHGAAALLTLPEGLDWRTQPFSHAGGPGTRPMRAPRQAQRLRRARAGR